METVAFFAGQIKPGTFTERTAHWNIVDAGHIARCAVASETSLFT